jgi:hypothetical protein
MDDILLKVNRNNFEEETHFTIAYSPVPDPTATNGIGGVLATVNEITDEIIGKEAMRWFPDELGKLATTDLKTKKYAIRKPTIILADDNADMREYIKSVLDEFCNVHTVVNGKLALTWLKK